MSTHTEPKRLAIFVEGYTETVFVEKLIEEIAGRNHVSIEVQRISGGSSVPRKITIVRATSAAKNENYYVLIVDCGGDEQVKSRILEEHNNLTRKGYTEIIGLRDVRPDFAFADINKLRRYLPLGVKTSLAPVTFILAVMEVEAWFLAETTHLTKIDPSITLTAIQEQLGFDPSVEDLQQRTHPTEDLKLCYAIAGQTYAKKNAQQTVSALDFTEIYFNTSSRFEDLKNLIQRIDVFLSAPPPHP